VLLPLFWRQLGDPAGAVLAEIGRGQVKAVKIRATIATSRAREAKASMAGP
jgi:hypothetical protein